jgi:predicted O-methyltransferase YrrM
MNLSPERQHATSAYLTEVFGQVDDPTLQRQLNTLMTRAVAAGIPDIAVSPDVGRLLSVLTRMVTNARDSTGQVMELGTLAGYSAIWIARALPYAGRLYTIEPNDVHSDFAKNEFADAGVSKKVTIIPGRALDALPKLTAELGYGSLDMVFIDAVKTEYPDYARAVTPLLRVGGILVADNTLGSNAWWVTDPEGQSKDRDAVDRFNRELARSGQFETACVTNRQGLVVAVKIRQ